VARDWISGGVVDAEQPDEVNELFVPLIEHYPQISSLMIADGRGREHMLLCVEQRRSGTLQRQWKCRQTRRDEWENQVQWSEWNGDQREDAETRTEQLDYDPRTRPWFQGALTKNRVPGIDSKGIHWTQPYVFFTTKDLGITASTAVDDTANSDSKTVVAFDVLLEDITRFTIQKHPTQNGKVFVLTEKGELIGLPNDPSFPTSKQWKQVFLKHLSDLDQPYARDASKAFKFSKDSAMQIRSFQSKGSTWWGAAKPFQLGDDLRLWTLVLLPESDLQERLAE